MSWIGFSSDWVRWWDVAGGSVGDRFKVSGGLAAGGMEADEVRAYTETLPREPGVYLFRSPEAVLYIGKAVDLRSRVRSYADPRGTRVRRMLREASEVDVAVTDTETQALLLEANLIKRHQPRYNVRLTDDKSYPLVQLTAHPHPRIEVTRDPDANARVWGPFTDKGRVDTVVKALRETYGVRGCSDHKFANRERPCLDYEMGLCTAPCTGEIAREAYVQDADRVAQFMDGSTGILVDPLREQMEAAAAERSFERAAHLRDRIEAAGAMHGGGGEAVRSSGEPETQDVIGVVLLGDHARVARLHADGGRLVDRDRHSVTLPGSVTPDRVMAAFLPQYYAERPLPDVLVLSDRPEDGEVLGWLEREGVRVTVPGTGREARLVDLALKNARRGDGADDSVRLGEALGLAGVDRIEGFDVSHAGGKATVGSNVVFVGGSPEKTGYRRKRLDAGNDDYEAMRELVGWRAARAVEGRDDRPDPDLLLIDGGSGQRDAAVRAVAEAGWERPVVALAKPDEVVVTDEGREVWPADASHLHLLQRVRDEAHRFARQYHQVVRDEITTALDDVPGVGPRIRTRLLQRFGSVEGVRAASADELESVAGVGPETAAAIKRQLG